MCVGHVDRGETLDENGGSLLLHLEQMARMRREMPLGHVPLHCKVPVMAAKGGTTTSVQNCMCIDVSTDMCVELRVHRHVCRHV